MAAKYSPLHMRLLGNGLRELREAASLNFEDAAARLARGHQAIRRFEDGKNLIDVLQLELLCELYGATKEATQRLVNLRELARQPVWWAHLGPRPPATAGLLSMEESAWGLWSYDINAIPGLLQTPSYARAHNEAVVPNISPQQLETSVELRMQRQERVWQRDGPPEAVFLIDENVLWRMPGSIDAKRAQLSRLLTKPESATVQVVPFDAGSLPALGTFCIFGITFDPDIEFEGLYVEGSANGKGFVGEAESEIEEYKLVFEQTRAKALSPRQSAQHIKKMMKGIHDE